MTYRTGGANIHNSARGAKKLIRAGLHDVHLCESNQIQSAVRRSARANGYRVTNLDHPGTDVKRKSLWDNTLLTTKDRRSEGSVALVAGDRAEPYRIAPDRTLVAEMSVHPGLGVIGRIGLHPHYIGDAHDSPRNPRVATTDRFNRVLADLVDMLTKRCDHVVASGDVNLAKAALTPGWLSTWEVFGARNFNTQSFSPIDAVFWTPSLEMADFKTWSARELFTDHPGFTATFRARRKR